MRAPVRRAATVTAVPVRAADKADKGEYRDILNDRIVDNRRLVSHMTAVIVRFAAV